VGVKVTSYQITYYDPKTNKDLLFESLDMVQEGLRQALEEVIFFFVFDLGAMYSPFAFCFCALDLGEIILVFRNLFVFRILCGIKF